MRKRRIMARLGGIQKAHEIRPSSHLERLEGELRREFELICEQESMTWA